MAEAKRPETTTTSNISGIPKGYRYQVDYDRAEAQSSQWERLNFILRLMQEQMSALTDSQPKELDNTTPDDGKGGNNSEAPEGGVFDFAWGSASIPARQGMSVLWHMAWGERNGLREAGLNMDVDSGQYIAALNRLGTGFNAGAAWVNPNQHPVLADPAKVGQTINYNPATLVTAVKEWANARSEYMRDLWQKTGGGSSEEESQSDNDVPVSIARFEEENDWLQEQIDDLIEDFDNFKMPDNVAEEEIDWLQEQIDDIIDAVGDTFDVTPEGGGSSVSSSLGLFGYFAKKLIVQLNKNINGAVNYAGIPNPFIFPDLNKGKPYVIAIMAKGGGGSGGQGRGGDWGTGSEAGGSSETVFARYIVGPGDTLSYSVGAGGVGAVWPQWRDGNNGGNTTFTVTVDGVAKPTIVAQGGTRGSRAGDWALSGPAGVESYDEDIYRIPGFSGGSGGGHDEEDNANREPGGAGGGPGGGKARFPVTGFGAGSGGGDWDRFQQTYQGGNGTIVVWWIADAKNKQSSGGTGTGQVVKVYAGGSGSTSAGVAAYPQGQLVFYTGTGTVTYTWAQTSGPASATITGIATLTPTITCSVDGDYTFAMTGTDGTDSDTDVYTLSVGTGSGSTFLEVTINPTFGQMTGATGSATLTSTVVNSGGAVTYQWERVYGVGNVTFATPTAASTVMTVDSPGVQSVRLIVYNGTEEAKDEVHVVVFPAGGLMLNSPYNPAPIAITEIVDTVSLPAAGSMVQGKLYGESVVA